MKPYLLLLLLFFLFAFGCSKGPQYPAIPQIDFKQVAITDTTDALGNIHAVFSIYFKILDGDGNFGFKDSDTLDPNLNVNNFFIDIYTKWNDSLYKINNDSVSYDGKIPWVAPVGVNTYYKSTVVFDLDIYAIPFDSIKFVIQVADRAKNKSNKDSTMWIPYGYRGILADTVNTIPDN